jgi:hypothetical protein
MNEGLNDGHQRFNACTSPIDIVKEIFNQH